MNALERKLSNLIYDHKKEFGHYPKFAQCTIRWNNDKDIVQHLVIAFYPYDCDNEDKDDSIFYYLDNASNIYSLLANIDFVIEDFESAGGFYDEVEKYDTDDEDDDDYSILHRGEDFCIINIECVFDNL